VTANVAMNCSQPGFELAVGAGTPTAYVLYTAQAGGFVPTLFKLDLGTQSANVETVPTNNWPAKVFATNGGAAYLAAYSADGATHDAMAVYERPNGAWRRTDLEGGAYVTIGLGNGVHHPDGRESFVYARGDLTGDYRAATRAADGTWTTSTLRSGRLNGLFGIDVPQPYVANTLFLASWYPGVPDTMSRTLQVAQGSTAPAPLLVGTPGNQYGPDSRVVAIASRTGSPPIVSLGLDDGVHVFVGSTAGYADHLVPTSVAGSDPPCPGPTATSMPCAPGSCTERGTVGASASHDLVRTADGRVWLVYVQTHLDLDLQISNLPNSQRCSVTPTADRSRTELVVVEVGATLTERARVSLPDHGTTGGFDVDVVGSVLEMAWLGVSNLYVPNPIFIRFAAIETSGLP
jgi:hypothetical protein